MDLRAAQRLCDEATPGPWALWTGCSWRRFGSEHPGHHREVICPTNHPHDHHPDLILREEDGRFVAEARTLLPEALAEIARLRALVKEAEWADRDHWEPPDGFCPWCSAAASDRDHAADCPAFHPNGEVR